MAEAEPVIRSVLPDANVPTSIRGSGIAVEHASVSELNSILGRWLAEHADGTACIIGEGATAPSNSNSNSNARVYVLSPELAKGLEFDLVVLLDPETFGTGIQGAVDRYVAMTRATQQLVLLTTP